MIRERVQNMMDELDIDGPFDVFMCCLTALLAFVIGVVALLGAITLLTKGLFGMGLVAIPVLIVWFVISCYRGRNK